MTPSSNYRRTILSVRHHYFGTLSDFGRSSRKATHTHRRLSDVKFLPKENRRSVWPMETENLQSAVTNNNSPIYFLCTKDVATIPEPALKSTIDKLNAFISEAYPVCSVATGRTAKAFVRWIISGKAVSLQKLQQTRPDILADLDRQAPNKLI